jgi:3-deoxy-D-manno-octulosonate 8-phosphate phosphatase (KDO 8-P phosphatase)
VEYLGLGAALPDTLLAIVQQLKLVIFDIDGVMTDGRLYYGAEGEVLKAFNVKDGVGLKLLRAQGIEVAVISAKSSMPLQKRMTDLGVIHFYPGTKNKLEQMQALCQQLEINKQEVAFVGDDVIDLKVLPEVGLFIAPKDAHPIVKRQAHHVTQTLGGQGVVREVADQLLSARMDLETAYLVGMEPKFEEQDYDNKIAKT